MSRQECTPTTAEIRDDYVLLNTRNFDAYLVGHSLGEERMRHHEAFDRWLATHDAEVRADERAKRPDRAALERIAAECEADIPYDDGNETAKLIGKRIREALALEPEAREVTDEYVEAAAASLAETQEGVGRWVSWSEEQRDVSGLREDARAALEAARGVE